MEKIKNVLKKYQNEILLIGGTIIVIGGCIFLFKTKVGTPKKIFVKPPKSASFVPNDIMGTVDLFVGTGSNKTHLYVFDVYEAEGLLNELKDCLACLKS